MFASNHRDQTGLTLLEVLVALTVAGIALTILLQGFGLNLRSLSVSAEYVTATQLARERMLELEALKSPVPGVQDLVAGAEHPGVRIKTEIAEEGPKGFHRVQVRVLFQRAGQEREVVLNSLLIKKAAEPGAESSARSPG